jgi:hypothetical protein
VADFAGQPPEGPREVCFTANLRGGAVSTDEDPGAVHVIRTRIFRLFESDQQALANGDSLRSKFLDEGIAVDLDGPLAAATVDTPHPTSEPNRPGIPSNPTVFLTCELPWPLLAGERADLRPILPNLGSEILGFRPFIIRSEITFLKAGSKEVGKEGPDVVRVKPDGQSMAFLNALFPLMLTSEIPQRLLMRLTLKGNFIWRETAAAELKRNGPAGWLDGDAWMVTRAQHPSALQSQIDPALASGDRRRGGDFEMWFWLIPGGG